MTPRPAQGSAIDLLLWHWGRRGGGPRYTLELARALAQRSDLRLHLSLSRQSEIFPEFERLGLPGFHVDTYTDRRSAAAACLRLPRVRRGFGAYLRANRIDVVDCTMSHLWNAAVAPAIRRAGARFVLTLHDAVPHPGENHLVRKWLLGREIAEADAVIALSRHVRDQLCAVYGYPRARTRIAPHGVFPYGAGRERTFPRGRPFRLLFFGRILPYKGLDLLIAAFDELRRAFPELELVVAGPGDLSPHAAALAATPGVTVVNRWIPEDEIGAVLEEADLVVAPYTEASQSGVIPTGYGAGLPAVATPVGGLAEQVRDMETGVVAERPTDAALAAAIRRVVSDPALYERLSRGALAEARGALAWPAIAARVAEAVHVLAAEPSSRTHG